MSVRVIFETRIEHLKEIENWLIEEEKQSNEGFGCKIPTIRESFNRNRLIVITKDNISIGFLTYFFSYDVIVDIGICEIKPEEREKGFGKILLEKSCMFFVENGVLVAQLFCSSENSEIIWKRIGFNNFPDGIIRESRIYLYKILVNTAKCYTGNEQVERIELWNYEDYRDITEPTWIWELKRKNGSNELIKPIVHPSHYEWSVSHVINEETTEKTIMKNFNYKKHDRGNFLVIKEFETRD